MLCCAGEMNDAGEVLLTIYERIKGAVVSRKLSMHVVPYLSRGKSSSVQSNPIIPSLVWRFLSLTAVAATERWNWGSKGRPLACCLWPPLHCVHPFPAAA